MKNRAARFLRQSHGFSRKTERASPLAEESCRAPARLPPKPEQGRRRRPKPRGKRESAKCFVPAGKGKFPQATLSNLSSPDPPRIAKGTANIANLSAKFPVCTVEHADLPTAAAGKRIVLASKIGRKWGSSLSWPSQQHRGCKMAEEVQHEEVQHEEVQHEEFVGRPSR